MSAPQYSGTIEFPAKFIEGEIKELLAEHYEVRFKEPDPREQDHELELQDAVFDESEVKIVDGIFFFHDGEARYGEFYELEDLLVKKGIPFDRESGMDWNAPPAIRIYRPGPPAFDHTDSTPDSYDEVVSVSKLRELLAIDDAGEYAASAIRRFLDESFPSYRPLADYVTEADHA